MIDEDVFISQGNLPRFPDALHVLCKHSADVATAELLLGHGADPGIAESRGAHHPAHPLHDLCNVTSTTQSPSRPHSWPGLSDPYVQLLVEPEEAMVKQTGGKKTGYHKKAEVCESLAAQSKVWLLRVLRQGATVATAN